LKKLLILTLLTTSLYSQHPKQIDPHSFTGLDTVENAQEILGLPIPIKRVSPMPFPTPVTSTPQIQEEVKKIELASSPKEPTLDVTDKLIHHQMKQLIKLKNYLDAIRIHFKNNEAKCLKEMLEIMESFAGVDDRVRELYPEYKE
jgi:hypothetical protein